MKKPAKRGRIVLFVELADHDQKDQLEERAISAGCLSVAEYVRRVLFSGTRALGKQ